MTGLGLVARLGAFGRRDAAALLRGRCGTWRHPPSFHVDAATSTAGVALMALGWL